MSKEADWAAFRARYPAANAWTFLNAGSRGLLSDRAHAAGAAALDDDRLMRPPAGDAPAEARRLFARLIGAAAEEVAITRNVSEGLNAVANAIDWRAGDNVVACTEVEHANNVYLWHALARRGVALRDVPARNGAIDAADMAGAMDRRTRLVTASAVSFTPGFRAPLAPIGAAAGQVGALFLVDGVQACGVLPLDMQAEGIDALATSTSKGLLGVRGFGFLYVRGSRVAALVPTAVARTSMDTGGAHYSAFEGPDSRLRGDARRFECGGLNPVGAAVAAASLAELLEVGVGRIAARVLALAAELRAGLRAQGWPVVMPPTLDAASHLVCVGARGPGGADATGDPRLDQFARTLEAEGVKLAIRRRLLRFGLHAYNDERDIAHVLRVGARLAPQAVAA